jgi:lysophospholipase L1-like esterase
MMFAADRTQHLLWRLTEGGELPATIRPDVVVLLIGTNNLAQNTVESVALGIQDIVDVMHKALPKSTILLNEIFPRYDAMIVKANKTKSVSKLNAILKDYYLDHKATSNSITYLQCGSMFGPTAKQHEEDRDILVNTDLMPDKLHPNAAGMKRWLGECVLPPALEAIRANKK